MAPSQGPSLGGAGAGSDAAVTGTQGSWSIDPQSPGGDGSGTRTGASRKGREGPSVDANWEVRYLSATETVPLAGSLRADIYMVTNAGNLAAFDAIVAGGAPAGTAFIEQIDWNANAYTRTNAAGANLFAAAVPGSFLGDQNDYGVNLVGEIHIPSDADRDGLEAILFHDGVDDFCYLEIDGVWEDHVRYAMTSEEWDARRDELAAAWLAPRPQ